MIATLTQVRKVIMNFPILHANLNIRFKIDYGEEVLGGRKIIGRSSETGNDEQATNYIKICYH